MKEEKVIDLTTCELKDVKQQIHPTGSIYIHFTLNGSPFELEVEQHKNRMAYRRIYHGEKSPQRKCPFCNFYAITCQGLTRQTKQVFETLIQRPEIRLYWVTKKHLIN